MNQNVEKLDPIFYLNQNRSSFEKKNDPIDIGKIEDNRTGEIIALIIYDRNSFKDLGYHCCVRYNTQSKEYYIIIDQYYSSMIGEHNDEFAALLLHEVGHIVNGDFTKGELNPKTVRKDRANTILNGYVAQNELDADLFAVQIVGEELFLKTLDLLIQKRKERENDPYQSIAIQEFEDRKKAVYNELRKKQQNGE